VGIWEIHRLYGFFLAKVYYGLKDDSITTTTTTTTTTGAFVGHGHSHFARAGHREELCRGTFAQIFDFCANFWPTMTVMMQGRTLPSYKWSYNPCKSYPCICSHLWWLHNSIYSVMIFCLGIFHVGTPPKKLRPRDWKMMGMEDKPFLLKWSLFRGHVNFRGVPFPIIRVQWRLSESPTA